MPTETTFGVQTRYDAISLGLTDTYQRTFLANIRSDNVGEGSVGIYGENTIHWTKWFRTTLGWRGDYFEGTDSSIYDALNSGRTHATIGSPKATTALARWNTKMHPERIKRGRFLKTCRISVGCRGAGGWGVPPWAESGSISREDIVESASNAGPTSTAVTMNTDPAERKYPHAPMAAAARPLPMEAKRALRPSRSRIAACPTNPRLIAAIAGPSRQLAAECEIEAAKMTEKIGVATNAKALTAMATTAIAATSRSDRARSTTIPPGIWPISAARLPTVRTRPMSTCVHFCVVR
jgi:hypothetical protein